MDKEDPLEPLEGEVMQVPQASLDLQVSREWRCVLISANQSTGNKSLSQSDHYNHKYDPIRLLEPNVSVTLISRKSDIPASHN